MVEEEVDTERVVSNSFSVDPLRLAPGAGLNFSMLPGEARLIGLLTMHNLS
jgi:hypothetical protein